MKVWRQKNRKIKLKIDTPPYIHVCIIPFTRTSACIKNNNNTIHDI